MNAQGSRLKTQGKKSLASSLQPPASRGFTFVEMLVALSLLTLVSASIAATLSGGLSVWQRAQTVGLHDQALQVAVAQLQRDLHQVRRFAPLPFTGEYDEVSFPAMVMSATTEPAADEPVLGRLGYFFDSGRRRLCRSFHDYRDVRQRHLKDVCHPLLTDVERVRFGYYGWDESSSAYGWMSDWSTPTPPLAVKVELGWPQPAGRPVESQTIIVRLPLASSHEKHH